MKQNPSAQKEAHEDFSVLSFSSAPNESFQFQDQAKPQPSKNKTYCVIIWFVILGTKFYIQGFYFIVFGIVELSTNFNQINYSISLNRKGNTYTSPTTFISFKQNTSVLVYLEVQDLTQLDSSFNIRRQIKQCTNYKTNFQMKKVFSINKKPLIPQDTAVPCGRHASLYPEGKFQIVNIDDNTPVQIITQNISFSNDNMIPSSDMDPNLQWASFQNERFRNWMTVNAEQKIKKLWGRISEVVSGNYMIELTVNNEMPQVNKFNVFLSNNEALSGYNSELCYLNFFFAVILFMGALSNFLIQLKWGNQKVLKKKPMISGQGNQIKIYLNSGTTTPVAKFD